MKMHSDLGKMYRRNYMVKSQLRSLAEKSSALNAKIDGDTKIDEWAESYITRADAQIDDVSDYMNYRNLGNLAMKGGRTGHVRIAPPLTRALPPPKVPIYGQERQPAPPPAEAGSDGLGNLAMKAGHTGHVRIAPPLTKALPAPKLPIYGQQRQPAPPKVAPPKDSDGDGVPDDQDKYPGDPTEWADSDNDGVPDNFDEYGGIHGFTDYLPQVTSGNTLGATVMLGGMAAVLGLVTYNEYRSKASMRNVIIPRLKRAGIFAAGGVGIAALYQGIVGTGQQTGWY